MLSVVAPLYNEGERALQLITHLRQLPGLTEAILVDASDSPPSFALIGELRHHLRADPLIRLLHTPHRGRAAQMNLGARHCRGHTIIFLHCDTRLPAEAIARITHAIATGHLWGWFDLRLDAPGLSYRLIERMINLRARTRRIATGDQAIFVQRQTFTRLHGFADIPLMEDLELSRRLTQLARPAIIPVPALTSARRWQQHGIARTVLLMWQLRLRYWLGTNPEQLARRYRDAR